MEKLYIETNRGKVPIDPEVVERLKLEKGEVSPFTRNRIVGENGDFPAETSMEKDPKNCGLPMSSEKDAENVQFSTSEIIDLAQGADSYEHR